MWAGSPGHRSGRSLRRLSGGYNPGMSVADELPIPDWGLSCPHCGHPIAGLPEHRCDACGEWFNIRHLLASHRPIPDVGLTCPNCDYSLTGLTGSRCPECGVRFSVREMLEDQSSFGAFDVTLGDPDDHHLKKREPTFTGHERPLPDFGLYCGNCDDPLAGAAADACPGCGKPFDLVDYTGNRGWVAIGRFVPREAMTNARTVLYGAQIPYLIDNARLNAVYSGRASFLFGAALRVPREFFFDALYTLMQSCEPPGDYAGSPWTCPACDEDVPAGFEVCWNCGRPHPLADVDAGGAQGSTDGAEDDAIAGE